MIKKESVFSFTIVRAEKPTNEGKSAKKPGRPKKPNRYDGIVVGMKRLNIGDYIVAAKDVPATKAYQKAANIKFILKQHLSPQLATREFEYKSIPEAISGSPNYQIIIRRTA